MGLKISTHVEVEASIEDVASWFAELSDKQQADFFLRVVEIAQETWTGDFETQWTWVGRNLSIKECSNDGVRDMFEWIANGIKGE